MPRDLPRGLTRPARKIEFTRRAFVRWTIVDDAFPAAVPRQRAVVPRGVGHSEGSNSPSRGWFWGSHLTEMVSSNHERKANRALSMTCDKSRENHDRNSVFRLLCTLPYGRLTPLAQGQHRFARRRFLACPLFRVRRDCAAAAVAFVGPGFSVCQEAAVWERRCGGGGNTASARVTSPLACSPSIAPRFAACGHVADSEVSARPTEALVARRPCTGTLRQPFNSGNSCHLRLAFQERQVPTEFSLAPSGSWRGLCNSDRLHRTTQVGFWRQGVETRSGLGFI